MVSVAHYVAGYIDAAIGFSHGHIASLGAQFLPTVPPRVGVISVAPDLHDLGIQVLVDDHYEPNVFPFSKGIRVSVSPANNHDVVHLLDICESETFR